MQNVMVLFGKLSFESNISNEVGVIVDSQSIVELTDHRFTFNILNSNSIYQFVLSFVNTTAFSSYPPRALL